MAKTSATATPEAAAGTTGGAARGPRSPNFPSITLADALQKARVLYDKDKRALSSLSTILTHLGFGQKLSGNAGRVISALRQFGLIEEIGGQYRVSEGAVRIFTLSDGAPERVAAIQASAQKPAVYREVFAHYQEGLPSDANLKDFLILKKKFNPDSVDTFIRVFKATIEFAKVGPGGYTEPDADPDGGGQPTMDLDQKKPPPPPKPPAPGVSREVFALGSNGVVALEWPDTLDAAALQDVEDWLKLVLRKLKRLKGSETG
jgi:hypothetical protein